jgi:hypothetical protein
MKRIPMTALGIALLTTSCQHQESPFPDTRAVPDGMPTSEEFEKGIQKYPYSASPERSAIVVSGLKKAERYMTKQQVLNLLGRPEYSSIIYGPKGLGERWLGSSWTYWLSKRDSGVNMYDPCVVVFFNTNGLADWIVPSNIAGAHEIGGPREKESSQQGAAPLPSAPAGPSERAH